LPTGTCPGYRTMSTRHPIGLTTHRATVMGLLWTGKATAMLSPRHPGMGRIHHRWDRSGAGTGRWPSKRARPRPPTPHKGVSRGTLRACENAPLAGCAGRDGCRWQGRAPRQTRDGRAGR
jgi:hypothetical protein